MLLSQHVNAGTCLRDRNTNLFRGNLGQSAILETEGKAAQWDPCPLVGLMLGGSSIYP